MAVQLDLPIILLVLTFVGGIITWTFNISSRLSKMEVKIDTLWDFQLRRGIAEALEKGVATTRN